MVLALTLNTPGGRTKQRKTKKSSRGERSDTSGTDRKASAAGGASGSLLAENDAVGIERGDWILDSEASRHLMSDDLLVIDLTACSYQISMADRATLRLTRVASVCYS